MPPRAVIGDKVILTFNADQPISNVRATIQGETVAVTDNGDGSYTAEYVVHAGSKSGYAAISIDYNFADGTPAYTVYSYPETVITNANNVQVSQKVLISDTSNEINVKAEAQLSGSDNTLTSDEITYLFDGKISTFSDVRYSGGGYGYYNLDFGASNSNKLMQLDRIEILNRSGFPGRAGAVSVSASVDGVTWRTISEVSKGYSYDIWQQIKVLDQYKDVAFRYFRIYGGNWYGNISELRMFGKVGEDLKRYDPTFTITTTASDPKAGTTLVYVNPNGLPPAPAPTGNEGSSLSVHGDQTAVTVVAKPAPGFEFVKWVEPTTSYGITADYLWSEYPVFNLTTYAGGYLGGAKTYNVVRDWNLKAVFNKIDWTAPVTTATVSPTEPDGQNGWYVHPVTVTLNTYDELSGVAKTEYSLDDGATWQTYASAVTLSQDGKYTFSYRSTDNAGNVEAVKTISFNLDTTAPVTVATPSQPDGANGWYKHQATVSLSAADNLAGLAMTEYSLDGGTTWQPYSSALTFDKEGKYTVSYRSADNAGNVEAVKTININLDSTPPVTTAVVTPAQPDGLHGWYVHPVTVTMSAYDNLSGVAKTEYSLDGGSTWLAYTAPVTLNQDSKYTVSYRSTDIAGNVEAAKTIGFNLDATAPTITVSGLVYGTYSDSMDITPILTLTDNLSGVDSSQTTVTISTYGVQQPVQQGATIPLYTLPLGSHTFIVTASDMAGNMSKQTITFQTTTSIQSLQALVTRFKTSGWIDNAGIANSLQSKLNANALADFVSEVQAQSGKHISAQAADYLLRDARYLLSEK
jgi:hypothetical protein